VTVLDISKFEPLITDENYALSSWDINRAEEWLKNNYVSPMERISLNNTLKYFKTVRALLCTNEPELSLLLLAKIQHQACIHYRILDIIEAEILTSIAYNMSKNMKQALEVMTSAVINAQSYGFTALFVIEAREIYSILNELSFQITRSGDAAGIDTDFLSRLCVLTGKKLSRSYIHNYYKQQSSIKLTDKQISAAKMLAKGCSYKEIAQNMGVTLSTVKSYLQELYNKLGAFNSTEALEKLFELDILREGTY